MANQTSSSASRGGWGCARLGVEFVSTLKSGTDHCVSEVEPETQVSGRMPSRPKRASGHQTLLIVVVLLALVAGMARLFVPNAGEARHLKGQQQESSLFTLDPGRSERPDRTALQVSESAPMLLLGAGLLSLAALIRRRIVR